MCADRKGSRVKPQQLWVLGARPPASSHRFMQPHGATQVRCWRILPPAARTLVGSEGSAGGKGSHVHQGPEICTRKWGILSPEPHGHERCLPRLRRTRSANSSQLPTQMAAPTPRYLPLVLFMAPGPSPAPDAACTRLLFVWRAKGIPGLGEGMTPAPGMERWKSGERRLQVGCPLVCSPSGLFPSASI